MFQLHVSIIIIGRKEIILFHNFKFLSGVGFTSVLSKVFLVFAEEYLLAGILAAVSVY